MSDHQHACALTDDALDGDIARALAVDPSPEFAARVRTRIANEPERGVWRPSWTLGIAGTLVAMVVLAALLLNRSDVPVADLPLAARAIPNDAATLPYVVSAFRRTYSRPSVVGPAEAGPHVHVEMLDLTPLLDPRETRALRALLAGVRDSRVDLSPLLRPGVSAPMELPPVADLVIAPLAIEPLAPNDGAEGVRQ